MSAEPSTGGRLLYVDNIRILLISLVIATHAAITYGAYGSWIYVEVSASGESLYSLVLTLLTSLFQSFFMGLFFLIAAYFVPASLERKGARRYVLDRLVRLGIPMVIWVLFIAPPLFYFVEYMTGKFNGSLLDWYWLTITHFQSFGLGPLWFLLSLLVFTLMYVGWREIQGEEQEKGGDPSRSVPSFLTIVTVALGIGILTFLVRLVFPIGSSWALFDLQFSFFVQYIAYFLIGLYAARHRWLNSFPSPTGRNCGMAALVLIVIQPILLIILVTSNGSIESLLGGFFWQALVYAIWEQLTGMMISIGLLWVFSLTLNNQGPITQAAAADSYTAYIVQIPILLTTSLALRGIMLPPILKFLLVITIVIPLSFTVAHLIRSLPGVKRVL
ncbi:MAG: acyltransferase family protein [Methanomicrobiales archaeon]|nr:acyltransferase family protein [Methanomicrobiales archaeon]